MRLRRSLAADFREEPAALEPQWRINVEGYPDGLTAGETFPGDVFFRETDAGLCVIDVDWPTLLESG